VADFVRQGASDQSGSVDDFVLSHSRKGNVGQSEGHLNERRRDRDENHQLCRVRQTLVEMIRESALHLRSLLLISDTRAPVWNSFAGAVTKLKTDKLLLSPIYREDEVVWSYSGILI
jgi:hypothetical protein